jgi:hypothetical protein
MENIRTTASDAPIEPVPSNLHVQEVIRRAEHELRHLMDERTELTTRICTVKRTIVGLANLFGDAILDAALSELVGRDSGTRQPGITRACRRVLLEAGRPMSAREICDEIQRSVPLLLARHKEPLATIYTILGRLVEYGEVTALPGDRGQRAWIWAVEHNDDSSAPESRHVGSQH